MAAAAKWSGVAPLVMVGEGVKGVGGVSGDREALLSWPSVSSLPGVLGIGVGAVLNQHLDCVLIAPQCCNVQRCLPHLHRGRTEQTGEEGQQE